MITTNDDAAIAQRARERVGQAFSQQRVDPAILEGDRSSQGVCKHDEAAAHDEREPAIEPSRDRVRRSSRARAVQAEQSEVLRGEVVTHQQIVEDGEPDHALGQRHRQHALGRQQHGEAGDGDGQRGYYEAQPLRREQGAVGRGRIGQPGRRDAMAEPQRHREGEEQPVDRTGANVVMTPASRRTRGANHSGFRTQTRSQAGLLIQRIGRHDVAHRPGLMFRRPVQGPGAGQKKDGACVASPAAIE